uniref:Peptidase C39 domain-containing protein n=1 Tax=viral metagenome TaxID=1070528 RepID=A0A6C0HYX4_9ZZZZ
MKTRKSRKGGQPVKNMPTAVRFHKSQRNVHDKDCGASVVKFLGYATEEDSDYLARKTPNGIRSPVMLKMLWRAYGNKGFRWQHVHEEHPEDLQELKVNERTIAFYLSSETSGHYFVVFRRPGAEWAIDPQTNEIFPLSTYLNTPFKRATFNICLVDDDQTSINYGDSRITKEIIDEVLQEQDELAAKAKAEAEAAEEAEAEQAED